MRILSILGLAVSIAGAVPDARFDAEDLVIHDGKQMFRVPDILDSDAFYGTIHAVQRRGRDYFVVYGTSELSRGWPARDGNCGCGIESYIRWLHIRDGKTIAQQEGKQESCIANRDGWSIAWRQGRLVWSTEGMEHEGDRPTGRINLVSFTWSFDPACPASGIVETKSPTKRQPNPPRTEPAPGQPPPTPTRK